MKQKFLTVAVVSALALGVAGHVHSSPAVDIDGSGMGNVLLSPFYSVENGNDTYIHLVNTSANGKALKIRFREAMGSEDSLDFQLFMSPKDVWTAVLTADGNNVVLRTSNSSCTLPAIPAQGQALQTTYIPDAFSNEVFSKEDRIRQGYIEFIEMMDLGPQPIERPANGAANTLAWFSKHVNSVPRDCGVLADFSRGLVWSDGPTLRTEAPTQTLTSGTAPNAYASTVGDVVGSMNTAPSTFRPSGGLFGNTAIINVENGTMIQNDMVALHTTGAFTGPIYYSQSTSADVALNDFTADRGLVFEKIRVGGATGLQFFDLPDLSTYSAMSTVSNDLGLLAATNTALAATALHNEYQLDAARLSETDWVVTFPTKRFHVSGAYITATGATRGNPITATNIANTTVGTFQTAGEAIVPFENRFNERTGAACDTIGLEHWDRNENRFDAPTDDDLAFSPGRPDAPQARSICWEANVISFKQDHSGYTLGDPSAVVGGVTTVLPIELSFPTGWATLTFASDAAVGGLPVIGYAAFTMVNQNAAPGILANYGGAHTHRRAIP